MAGTAVASTQTANSQVSNSEYVNKFEDDRALAWIRKFGLPTFLLCLASVLFSVGLAVLFSGLFGRASLNTGAIIGCAVMFSIGIGVTTIYCCYKDGSTKIEKSIGEIEIGDSAPLMADSIPAPSSQSVMRLSKITPVDGDADSAETTMEVRMDPEVGQGSGASASAIMLNLN